MARKIKVLNGRSKHNWRSSVYCPIYLAFSSNVTVLSTVGFRNSFPDMSVTLVQSLIAEFDTFSRGVYCGWWWGMTGLLALVLYATRNAHLLKSLLLGPLVCNKLLWKNSASPGSISTNSIGHTFSISFTLSTSAPVCPATIKWSILPHLWEPRRICRQPLALLHLSMEIKTVNISGNKQPFLYQYLKVNKKSHFNYLSFNNTSILQNHTLVLVTTGLVIIKKVFDWSVDKIQTNS